MPDSKLEKLTIHSFKDKSFNQKDFMVFTIPVNPESIKRNCKIELENRKGHGSAANKSQFKSSGEENIQFEFILDGTNTIMGYDSSLDGKSVKEQLETFLKCTYYLNGEIHKPPFLILFWGKDFKFRCQLSNLDINYTLFNPDGSPLRIKINTTFEKFITPEESAAANHLKSADLSHYRIINDADRLDNMTYKFYNDPNYLTQIARVNDLTNLRNLIPGKTIFFPPFDKNNN